MSKRVTVVVDRDRVVRGRYDDPRDFAGHSEHALQILASLT